MGFCRRIPIRLSQFLTQTPLCPIFCSVEFAGHRVSVFVPAGVFYVCSEFFEFGGVVIVAVYFYICVVRRMRRPDRRFD